jgi:hypothetical protein
MRFFSRYLSPWRAVEVERLEQSDSNGAATTRAAGDDTTDRAQLHRWHRPLVVPQLALVTLEHTPVDIVMSVER